MKQFKGQVEVTSKDRIVVNEEYGWLDIYDENGKQKYFENSNGFWFKHEFDEKGNRKYFENSDGSWAKREYDENGKQTYFENSYGYIIDKRLKTRTKEEPANIGYKLEEDLQ